MSSTSDANSLRLQFERELSEATREAELRAIRDRYLARKGGLVSNLLKGLAAASPDERPRLGQSVNALKAHIEAQIASRLDAASANARPKDAIDVTLPGRAPAVGWDPLESTCRHASLSIL